MPDQVQPASAPSRGPVQTSAALLKKKFLKNKALVLAVVIPFWLIICLIIAYVIAETGFITIPVLSRWYDGPKPLRIITAQKINWEGFEVLLSQRIRDQRLSNNPSSKVSIAESELTGLLHSVEAQALRNSSWRVEDSQIVLEPEYVELFIRMRNQHIFKLDLLFKIKPLMDDQGNLKFEMLEFRMGDYDLPTDWGMAIVGNVFSRDFGSWMINVDGQKAIKDLSLVKGALDVILYK